MDALQLERILDKHIRAQDEPELLLLKGHLVLELCLNEFLKVHIRDEEQLDRLNLTFAKKVDLIVALGHELYTLNAKGAEGTAQVRELNRIRNKLAHQLDFAAHEDDFKRWACAVVGYKPKSLRRRATYVNTVKKAFYVLAAFLSGVAISKHEQAHQ